jgi:hypothetical protein
LCKCLLTIRPPLIYTISITNPFYSYEALYQDILARGNVCRHIVLLND